MTTVANFLIKRRVTTNLAKEIFPGHLDLAWSFYPSYHITSSTIYVPNFRYQDETNEIADKWQGKTVEVIGFATTDFVGSKADSMKVAEMEVFSQAICNNKLNTVLEQNKKCKSNR